MYTIESFSELKNKYIRIYADMEPFEDVHAVCKLACDYSSSHDCVVRVKYRRVVLATFWMGRLSPVKRIT